MFLCPHVLFRLSSASITAGHPYSDAQVVSKHASAAGSQQLDRMSIATASGSSDTSLNRPSPSQAARNAAAVRGHFSTKPNWKYRRLADSELLDLANQRNIRSFRNDECRKYFLPGFCPSGPDSRSKTGSSKLSTRQVLHCSRNVMFSAAECDLALERVAWLTNRERIRVPQGLSRSGCRLLRHSFSGVWCNRRSRAPHISVCSR